MTTRWVSVDAEKGPDGLDLSHTDRLEVDDGWIYRTVVVQAPASVACALVWVAKSATDTLNPPSRIDLLRDRMNQYQVARYLNVGVQVLRNLRKAGTGPPFTRGWHGEDRHRIFYSRSAVIEWVAGQEHRNPREETTHVVD